MIKINLNSFRSMIFGAFTMAVVMLYIFKSEPFFKIGLLLWLMMVTFELVGFLKFKPAKRNKKATPTTK